MNEFEYKEKIRKQESEIKRLESALSGSIKREKEKDQKLDSIRDEINYVLKDAIVLNDCKRISDIQLHHALYPDELIARYKAVMIKELSNMIIGKKYKVNRKKDGSMHEFELNVCLIDYNKLRSI
jgi:hypothetical protein